MPGLNCDDQSWSPGFVRCDSALMQVISPEILQAEIDMMVGNHRSSAKAAIKDARDLVRFFLLVLWSTSLL